MSNVYVGIRCGVAVYGKTKITFCDTVDLYFKFMLNSVYKLTYNN